MNAERYGSTQNEDVSQLTDGAALRGYAEGFVRSGEHTRQPRLVCVAK